MKTLKLLTATMLLLVAMAAGAETISQVTIGNLVYSLDTDTKVATVTGYDSSNKPTDVVIPNTIEYGGKNYSVTTIGERAFYNCTSLASIDIPNSVTTIGELAFNRCTSLAFIDIPNSVMTIGKRAFFNCTSLASVNIPNSVTTIGERAFTSCTSLASVNIPNSVTTIGEGAFNNCTSLASISVASDNPNYIGIDGVLFNKDKTIIVVYPAGKDGSEYTIPNSVTTIGEWAFGYCFSLASIDIPNSVTTIGEGAFYHCFSLASIDIPNSVTTIGDNTFYYCN